MNIKILSVTGTALALAASSANISTAQDRIARDLADPESAQFRDLKENSVGSGVCGEINAKNKLGAYTGFKKFFYDAKVEEGMIEPGSPDAATVRSATSLCASSATDSESQLKCDAVEGLTATYKAISTFSRRYSEVCYAS